jgi:hypothetical protein
MPSNCPAVSPHHVDDAFSNVTELIYQRYQDSPKEDWERLKRCWGYGDCGDCHRAVGHCGWCAIVRLLSHMLLVEALPSEVGCSICTHFYHYIPVYPMPPTRWFSVSSCRYNYTTCKQHERRLNFNNSPQHVSPSPQTRCPAHSLFSPQYAIILSAH